MEYNHQHFNVKRIGSKCIDFSSVDKCLDFIKKQFDGVGHYCNDLNLILTNKTDIGRIELLKLNNVSSLEYKLSNKNNSIDLKLLSSSVNYTSSASSSSSSSSLGSYKYNTNKKYGTNKNEYKYPSNMKNKNKDKQEKLISSYSLSITGLFHIDVYTWGFEIDTTGSLFLYAIPGFMMINNLATEPDKIALSSELYKLKHHLGSWISDEDFSILDYELDEMLESTKEDIDNIKNKFGQRKGIGIDI